MADLTHVVINQAHCSYIASRPRYGQNAMTSEVTTTNDTSKHKHIVEEQWRTVLRQEKLESLRKELRLLQDYHEQDLAHKHATLERLESEFGTAEDQYRSAHAVHVQRLRQLVDLYEERLLSMEADFQGKLEHLQQEYTSEREAIVAQHDGNRQVLLGQIEALKTQEKGRRVQDEHYAEVPLFQHHAFVRSRHHILPRFRSAVPGSYSLASTCMPVHCILRKPLLSLLGFAPLSLQNKGCRL